MLENDPIPEEKNNGFVVKKNEPLAGYCTYRIGGPAQCMFDAASEDEAAVALDVARSSGKPYFILGGGSNVLFADEGFCGMVIRMRNTAIELQLQNLAGMRVIVGAGTPLGQLVQFALQHSLAGLEWASGIPGTVGGALRGNAGAFHQEISECVDRIRVLEVADGKAAPKVFTKEQCRFSYRGSAFKREKNLIIVSAALKLRHGERGAIKTAMDDYLAKKATSQPLEYPSAGSVFINPPGFFAAKLIEECGFKGKIVGGAQVSEQHANFIINRGKATSQDVKELIAQIKIAVKEKFGVEMKEEIEIVGTQC